jgi:UDP-N-acetylglucosamine 1-carboxyvinyltransferase
VTISGSKNASLPILAAALLTEDVVEIESVPNLSDTNYMLEIMAQLGATIDRTPDATVSIKAHSVSHAATYSQVSKMRASICLLGPILARNKQCDIPLPGGCVIGDRPVDLHLKAMEALGAKVTIENGVIHISAPKGLVGTEVNLCGSNGPTVLGTDNLMMAATLARGTTIIESAACEPEVVDLANMLVEMGAKIEGAGTTRIVIHGVESLHGCRHKVIPDRIEAGTFMIASAMLDADITIKNVCRDHLTALTKTLQECGHSVEFSEDGTTVRVERCTQPKSVSITTAPHPGFPTDMQAQLTAMLATTPGISVIKETIFPRRFMHCAELSRMGANIRVDNGTAVITGVEKLSGAPVKASDLRASAALVLAALQAEGITEIHKLHHIDRGYENICEKLQALGAQITRLQDDDE